MADDYREPDPDPNPTETTSGEGVDPGISDEAVHTIPLTDEDGDEYVIGQQNIGQGDTEGGGEWPDPDAAPRSPAPGAAEGD